MLDQSYSKLRTELISWNITVMFAIFLMTLTFGFARLLEYDQPTFITILRYMWLVSLNIFLGLAIFGSITRICIHNITSTLKRFEEWKSINYEKILSELKND